MPRLATIALILLSAAPVLFPSVHAAAQKQSTPGRGGLDLAAQNAYTELAIPHAVFKGQHIDDSAPDNLQILGTTDENGELKLQLPPGQYAVELTADGCKPMRSIEEVVQGRNDSGGRYNLEAEDTQQQQQSFASLSHPGYAFFAGFVLDKTTHRPLVGAKIRFSKTGFETTSDATGFFFQSIPTINRSEDDPYHPEIEKLTSSLPGYKLHIMSGLELIEGSGFLLHLEMSHGVGVVNIRVGDTEVPPINTEDHQIEVETGPARSESLQNWLHGHVQTPMESKPKEESPAPNATSSLSAVVPPSILVGTES